MTRQSTRISAQGGYRTRPSGSAVTLCYDSRRLRERHHAATALAFSSISPSCQVVLILAWRSPADDHAGETTYETEGDRRCLPAREASALPSMFFPSMFTFLRIGRPERPPWPRAPSSA